MCVSHVCIACMYPNYLGPRYCDQEELRATPSCMQACSVLLLLYLFILSMSPTVDASPSERRLRGRQRGRQVFLIGNYIYYI